MMFLPYITLPYATLSFPILHPIPVPSYPILSSTKSHIVFSCSPVTITCYSLLQKFYPSLTALLNCAAKPSFKSVVHSAVFG